MSALTEEKGSSLKVAKVTAFGTAAVVILALQFTLFSAFLDLVTSSMLFGVGYLAGRFSK